MGMSPSLENRCKESENKLVGTFIILALVVSVLSAIIVPPNQVPDEIAHFIRSYEISNGKLVPGRNSIEVPIIFERLQKHRRLYAPYDQLKLLVTDDRADEIAEYLSTSNYPFLIYLPQSIGIALGRLFHLPPMGIFLLGRIFNALACAGGLFFAAKNMPGKKWLLMMLFCSPMALYLAGSYSPDGITNVVALFFICVVFAFARKNGTFTKKQIVLLGVAAWLLALCKINIVPLALLLVIIPYQRFGSPRNKNLFLLGCILIIAVTLIIWNLMVPLTPGGVQEGVRPVDQLLYVILNPFYYLSVLGNTFSELWLYYLEGWFGLFGWLDSPMPQLALLLYLVVLVFLAGLQDDRFVVSKLEKWTAGLVFFFSAALTFLTLYMVWTKYQFDLVLGVQGRYLIPLMPLLFLLLPSFLGFVHGLNRYQGGIALSASALIWVIALFTLTLRFYVPCGLSYLRDVDCSLPAEIWQGEPVVLDPLVEGMSITQEFVPDCDQMYRVEVDVSTHDRVNFSTLQVALLEAKNLDVLKEFVVDNRSIEDQKFILFFEPISDSKGQAYELHIVSDADSDNAISLIATEGEQYPSGKLYLNGVAQEGDLQFKYYCHVGVQAIR